MATLTLLRIRCTGQSPNFKFQPRLADPSGRAIGSSIRIVPDSPNVVNIPQEGSNPLRVNLANGELDDTRLWLIDLLPASDPSYGGAKLISTVGSGWCPVNVPGYNVEVFYRVNENAVALTRDFAIQVVTLTVAYIRDVAIAIVRYLGNLFSLLIAPFRRPILDRDAPDLDRRMNDLQTGSQTDTQIDSQIDSQDDSQDKSQG